MLARLKQVVGDLSYAFQEFEFGPEDVRGAEDTLAVAVVLLERLRLVLVDSDPDVMLEQVADGMAARGQSERVKRR